MIKFLTVIISIIFITNVFPQVSPESFYLFEENKILSKINSSNPVSNSILDIITIGDTVWLGTSRGVSVSFDRGENWNNFYGTTAFGTDNVSAIGYDKYTGTLWAATAKTVEGVAGEDVAAGTGLKYTTDNGVSWTTIPQPVDNENDTIEVYGINEIPALPVTVPEQTLTFDIAFTPGTIWITSFAGGLRKSTDMGERWQRVVIPPDGLDSINPDSTLDFCLSPVAGNFCGEGNLNHRAFSVISTDDTTLYVGTANGINKTTTAGNQFPSWVKFNHLNQEVPISGNFVTALGYNISNSTIWASTWRAEGETEFYGISSSTNGGSSWQTFLKDERTHNFGFKSSEVIVATDNGAFRSSNDGSSWILPTAIIDTVTEPTSKLYLRTSVYYSASSNGDDIWLGSNDGLIKLIESSFWNGTWKIYFASEPLQTDRETCAYPNPFSPRQEQIKIKYSTGGKASSVTIRIFDFGMNYVRTVIQNAPRTKTLEGAPDYWDGRDANLNLVPNGVYLYRVDVDSEEPLFGKIIVMQ